MESIMRSRLPAVLPRFLAIVVVCVLASTAVTFAAGNGATPPATPATPATPAEPAALVVPDVRDQAYVFAKGTLEDGGFAWKLEGGAPGYAANVVVRQSPSPGTRVVDTGAPLITLQLTANPSYKAEGQPENASPYAGTSLELADLPNPAPAPAATPKSAATPKPAAKPKAKPAAKPTAKPATRKPAAAKPSARPPAFTSPGAPAEPQDEISLLGRAKRLDAYVKAHPRPSNAAARHWLYQHTWIVTGAGFGWWKGAEALEVLVDVDRRVQRQWGIGAKSRRVAQQALAEVRAKS
jgi:PASTA domain